MIAWPFISSLPQAYEYRQLLVAQTHDRYLRRKCSPSQSVCVVTIFLRPLGRRRVFVRVLVQQLRYKSGTGTRPDQA